MISIKKPVILAYELVANKQWNDYKNACISIGQKAHYVNTTKEDLSSYKSQDDVTSEVLVAKKEIAEMESYLNKINALLEQF